uniref:Retrotransposon gag domain-containing protein n=1 Tax=Photinus pyralis TaxID=7054 RepID=A0A1Y1K192_PHOPY
MNALSYVRDKETATEMWESLHSMFAKKSAVNQLLVRKQLARLRMGDDDKVTSHLVNFENLIRKLKSSGAEMEETDLLAQFFLTLPEKYDPLITALQNLGKLSRFKCGI